jgi:hypothetical protein
MGSLPDMHQEVSQSWRKEAELHLHLNEKQRITVSTYLFFIFWWGEISYNFSYCEISFLFLKNA